MYKGITLNKSKYNNTTQNKLFKPDITENRKRRKQKKKFMKNYTHQITRFFYKESLTEQSKDWCLGMDIGYPCDLEPYDLPSGFNEKWY